MNSDDSQFLTSDEVAELLRIPRRTLDRYAHLGVGPTFYRVGRHRRYLREDVVDWALSRAVSRQDVAGTGTRVASTSKEKQAGDAHPTRDAELPIA